MLFYPTRRLVPVIGTVYRGVLPIQLRNFWNYPHSSNLRGLIREMDHHRTRVERSMLEQLPVLKIVNRFEMISLRGAENAFFRVTVDVSGFKPEEIQVFVDGNVLKIQAKAERNNADGSSFYQEMSREFTLPDNVKTSEMKSYLKEDGLLTIRVPYGREDGTRHDIPIIHTIDPKSR